MAKTSVAGDSVASAGKSDASDQKIYLIGAMLETLLNTILSEDGKNCYHSTSKENSMTLHSEVAVKSCPICLTFKTTV